MKLSTRGRYGLKAMVDLALSYGNGPVSTASLAAQQGISDAYLEQLISSLRKAGLVTSSRGAPGRLCAFAPAGGDQRRGDPARAGRLHHGDRLREFRACQLRQCMLLLGKAAVAEAAGQHQ